MFGVPYAIRKVARLMYAGACVSLLILVTSCANDSRSLGYADSIQDGDSGESMLIRFTNPVRGYKVSVVWNPVLEVDGAYGPAAITFEDPRNQSRHVFTTNFFWMPKTLLPTSLFLPNGDFNINAKGAIINVEFPSTNSPSAPMYFQDVSFDGKDELIIVERGMGTRGENRYTAYDFSCEVDEVFEGTRSVDYHNRVHEYYGSFDFNTEFDVKSKTMKMLLPNSAGSGGEILYGFVQILPDSLAKDLSRPSPHLGRLFLPIQVKSWDLDRRKLGSQYETFDIQPPVIIRSTN